MPHCVDTSLADVDTSLIALITVLLLFMPISLICYADAGVMVSTRNIRPINRHQLGYDGYHRGRE